MSAANAIGSAGVAILLVAFLLNLIGTLNPGSLLYRVLNALGAGLSCYASWIIGFLPFVILEATWCIVAIVAILKPKSPS
ncbi:MAG TPA: hypothetical protein VGI47_05510 [Candidatus Binataceae bacterium]|jgi:hypothetical protein